MRIGLFTIGMKFSCGGYMYRCTDVGTRTIIAIRLDKPDESWYVGPPFAIPEIVFDEYDFCNCREEKESG